MTTRRMIRKLDRLMGCTLIMIAVLLSGCQSAKQIRTEQLSNQIDPLIGQAGREEVARLFGVPDNKITVGESEFWEYKMRYGKRGHQTFDTYNTPLGKRDFYGYSYTDEREVFDEISFEFDGQGILRSWRCDVQR